MASAMNTPGRRLATFDIYVGNLPQDADQKKVGRLFSKFGEVHNIWINNSSDGNKFAIVKFYCEEDSLKAIEDVNGVLFEGGKPITCRKCTKRGSKKEGEPEGQDIPEGVRLPMPMKQRNPDIVPSFEASHTQGRREMDRILITFVETPIIMWGQKMSTENITELSSISEQLAAVCPEATPVVGKPDGDKIYAARYSEDNEWYRCIVKYFFGSDRVKVQYIDFGNTEEINPSGLVEIPKSLTTLPTCALKYMLHSLWCNNNQDQNGIKFLRELVEGQEVEIFTTARLSDHTGFYAEIVVNGVNVNDKMLEMNHAFRKPGLEQRGQKGRMMVGSGDANSSSGMKMNNLPNQRDGMRKFDIGPEKDELNGLRWKLKNLQSEYAGLSSRIQEKDVMKQVFSVQMLSSKVRKLRNQFPLNKEMPLDKAIQLVQSPGKINVSNASSLPDVLKSKNAHEKMQEEIVECTENALLPDLIEKRNALRKELHKDITATIEQIKQVPLQERGQQVQDVVTALLKHYDSFITFGVSSLPTLESVLPAYEEWKLKRLPEVAETRRQSDVMESSTSHIFKQLLTQISLDPEQEDEEFQEDLAASLRQYAGALQQEIAVSDVENGPDGHLIGSLVQAVLRDLKEESNCVGHFRKILQEFTNMVEQITPWLDTVPSLDKLEKVRSKLKSLKSKLRHKLADKVDAEENQEAEELETIAQDLEVIRAKLHDTLLEEDKLMSEMSILAKDHFPELLISCQDTGFKSYLKYDGLVKPFHAPEHYTMASVGSSSSGIFESQFAGEAVFIKEYFLSSGNHVSKDEFLSQMAAYSKAKSPHLEPISAVFFDKNNRHAYVQVKKNGDLLSLLVEKSLSPKENCQVIIRGLCTALHELSIHQLVHGQVQPEFVVVNDDAKARLLPPDFSLSITDRCRSKFTTASGLEMIAPEMKVNMMGIEPSHLTDVYCLGLLALWLYHPNAPLSEKNDGTVNFASLPLDRNLGIFLSKLLMFSPVLRPTAENTLRSEYLNQPSVIAAQSLGPPRHLSDARGMQQMINPPVHELDTSQQMCYSRNSASPALSQSSKDGLIFADTGDNIQVIANTRVPPPVFNENPVGVGNPHLALQMQGSQQRPPQQHIQPQHQPEQLPSQQQQQQQQQAPPTITNFASTKDYANRQSSKTFEIGTFDPTAYEVVTSPQPPNSSGLPEESASALAEEPNTETDVTIPTEGSCDEENKTVPSTSQEDENKDQRGEPSPQPDEAEAEA